MNPVPESALAAEARARVLIDGQLTAAGWVVQDTKDLNLSAGQGVARREAIMAAGHGRADYLLYLDKREAGALPISTICVVIADAIEHGRGGCTPRRVSLVRMSWPP